MFGRRLSHAGHSNHPEHPLVRRVVLTVLAAAILAALALLIVPPHAHGNFVYWSNFNGDSIGRAKINGAGPNNNFITGTPNSAGVAIDSKFIYWTEQSGSSSSIGRANLDGSGVNHRFITTGVVNPQGIAVTPTDIYWTNEALMGHSTIGHATIDGGSPTQNFIDPGPVSVCDLAADQSFLYYLDNTTPSIGRAPLGGGAAQTNFIPVNSARCGIDVDSNFVYWGTGDNTVGRAPIGGGAPQGGFISNASGTTQSVSGAAVTPQYVFWGNNNGALTGNFIGRANLNGASPNPTLVAGADRPFILAAAPSNKITVNSIKKNKKKGTASINTKVPGPGQATLNQTNTPPDVNAVAAGVKQVGLTITQASSFSLAVKPTGKTAKKLNRQIKKQLKKKRKAKAKVNLTVFIHFVPAGVAGVANTQQVTVTLVKQKKKNKK